MRAIVIRELGPPSVLKLEEIPVPSIASHEALVEIGAAGVSYHDVVERNGAYQRGVKLPLITGYEIAGTVRELGPQVTGLKVGDRVCNKPFHSCGMCRRCRNGMETACTARKGIRGGYAEFAAIPGEALVRIPDALDFATACVIGPTTAVALNAVRDVAKVRLGERVVVTGASGGLGLPTIELCAAAGATVFAVTRSPAKAGALREIGAAHVVIAGDGEDFSEAIKALTDGEGADVVIDNVGSRVFTPSFRSLAVGGRFAMVGQLFSEDIRINPARIFFKRATLVGVGSARRDQLEDSVRLVSDGKVRPRIAEILPLELAAWAHERLEAGEVVGRLVLQP